MTFPLPRGPGFSAMGSLHGASSGTISTFSASATPVIVMGVSGDRVGAFIFNNSPANAYVCFGTTGSLGAWTQKIAPSGSWAFPNPVYAGPVVVLFDATGVGALMVTEMTSPKQDW